MPLNRKFEYNYIGEIEFDAGCVCDLYSGNALMIALKEDKHNGEVHRAIAWFAADIVHLNKMLGLINGHTSMFDSNSLHRVKLDRNYSRTKEIVNVLMNYNQPITIEIF